MLPEDSYVVVPHGGIPDRWIGQYRKASRISIGEFIDDLGRRWTAPKWLLARQATRLFTGNSLALFVDGLSTDNSLQSLTRLVRVRDERAQEIWPLLTHIASSDSGIAFWTWTAHNEKPPGAIMCSFAVDNC